VNRPDQPDDPEKGFWQAIERWEFLVLPFLLVLAIATWCMCKWAGPPSPRRATAIQMSPKNTSFFKSAGASRLRLPSWADTSALKFRPKAVPGFSIIPAAICFVICFVYLSTYMATHQGPPDFTQTGLADFTQTKLPDLADTLLDT
jgi:hypothetical protein